MVTNIGQYAPVFLPGEPALPDREAWQATVYKFAKSWTLPKWHCTYRKKVRVKSLSRVRLFLDPVDCSPPGSSFPGILQARTLEWVAISYRAYKTLNYGLVSTLGQVKQNDERVRPGLLKSNDQQHLNFSSTRYWCYHVSYLPHKRGISHSK